MTEPDGGGGTLPPLARGGVSAGGDHALEVLEFPRVLALVAERATSGLGAERVRQLRPATHPRRVREELDATEEMRTFLGASEHWAPPAVPDIRGVLERLGVEGAVLDGAGLLGVRRLLASARKARRELPGDEAVYPLLAERASGLVREPDLQERLDRSLEESGEVAAAASSRLKKLRSELRDARSGLVDLLERFSRDLRDRVRVPDASVTVRAGRYCIPIRRGGRSEVGGIVHDESASGQTLFVEPPAAIEPMNRVRELEAEENREVQRILRQLTAEARPLLPALSRSLELLVELDALYARGRYALSHGAARPAVGGGADGQGPDDGGGSGDAEGASAGEAGAPTRGEYRVVEGYHPLLLAADEEAVPFDLALEPGESVLLVSGPNAGGKTVLLKSVGLLSAMAQSGILPPVGDGTRLPLFRRFFAVIGDEQSIDASLSTFSAQVASLREILEGSDGASLVLLDEVGSHTDPAEGAALAAEVLLRLARQAGLTVATSHLGALKALAGEDERVVNASLQFDRQRLRPTYRLRRDRPGRSYAFEIAQRLGLPGEVVEEARERLDAGERRMEDLLSELEAKEEELDRLTRRAEEQEEALARRGEELEEAARELERREEEVERAARERAEAYLLEARQEVEDAIRELQEAHGEAAGEAAAEEAASRARSRVESAVRRARDAMPKAGEGRERDAPEVEPGDRVRIRSLGKTGTVRELRGDQVAVESGGIRLTVPATDLELVTGEDDGSGERDAGARERPGAAGGVPAASAERRPGVEPKSEVHLRGLRVDEVERELLPYLDAAVVADLPRFRIVHGKGTGALREKVRQILAADPRVSSFRSGEASEGGTGVTVVEFE